MTLKDKELEECKHLCDSTVGCTAINYGLKKCALRACPRPPPKPTSGIQRVYKSYYRNEESEKAGQKKPQNFSIFQIHFGKLRFKCEECDQDTFLYMTQNHNMATLDKNIKFNAFRQLAPPSSKQDMGSVPLGWRGENISQIVSHGKMQSVC